MINLFGWLGSFFLTVCSVPQAYQAWKQGHADGLNRPMLWLWFLGDLLMWVYVMARVDWPLITAYTLTAFTVTLLLYYSYRGKT